MVLPPKSPMDRRRLAGVIEHSLLRPDATALDIEKLCAEARQHRFYCVCVHGSRVVQAHDLLEESGGKLTTTVGFPLGACDPDTKRFDAEAAADNGADEMDVVINIGRLKDGDHAY